DRPETARVTHAVVRVIKPDQEAQARAVAERVRSAVRGVTDPEEFMRHAQAVEHDGLELRAERLPAMTSDGRGYVPDAGGGNTTPSFDAEFARAAFAVPVGATSEPIKTQFGYHVILSEAHIPEQRVPLDVRRRMLRDEIIKQRAERAKDTLLSALSQRTPIEL